MKEKTRLRKILKYISGFQKRHGYLPIFLMAGITTFSKVQSQIYVVKILEKKYPSILQAIQKWENEDTDQGDGDPEPAPHPPGALKIKARGMTVQRKAEETMFQ